MTDLPFAAPTHDLRRVNGHLHRALQELRAMTNDRRTPTEQLDPLTALDRSLCASISAVEELITQNREANP